MSAEHDVSVGSETQGEAAHFLAELTHDFASSLHIEETLKHAIDRFMVYLDA